MRKIPLVKQAYLDADLDESELPDQVDAGALELQGKIQQHLLTDRDLSDRVSRRIELSGDVV